MPLPTTITYGRDRYGWYVLIDGTFRAAMPGEETARLLAGAPALLASLTTMVNWSHCVSSPDPFEELDGDIAAAQTAVLAADPTAVTRLNHPGGARAPVD